MIRAINSYHWGKGNFAVVSSLCNAISVILNFLWTKTININTTFIIWLLQKKTKILKTIVSTILQIFYISILDRWTSPVHYGALWCRLCCTAKAQWSIWRSNSILERPRVAYARQHNSQKSFALTHVSFCSAIFFLVFFFLRFLILSIAVYQGLLYHRTANPISCAVSLR